MKSLNFYLVMLSFLISMPAFAAKAGQSGNCSPDIGIPGETVPVTLSHDGAQRVFHVHLPSAYDCSERLPVVIGVHGYGGSGPGFESNTTGMFDHVNANNYIGVFPTGLTASASGPTAFNDLGSRNDYGDDGKTCSKNGSFAYESFENCGPDEADRQCQWGTSCADDAGFFIAMIKYVKQHYSVDQDRIYMMGFSQGGQTVASLACELARELAAVVPVHGFATNGYSCGPTSKVSLFQIWGTRDQWVRSDGRLSADGMQYDAANESAAVWASNQGCETEITSYQTAADGIKKWRCEAHANCSSGAEIVTCSWAGGHSWPNTRQDGNFGLDAAWHFMSSKSK